MTPTQAIFLALVAILVLLVVCPSRAGMWRSVEFFARIHAEANEHMDKQRAARAKANKLEEQS